MKFGLTIFYSLGSNLFIIIASWGSCRWGGGSDYQRLFLIAQKNEKKCAYDMIQLSEDFFLPGELNYISTCYFIRETYDHDRMVRRRSQVFTHMKALGYRFLFFTRIPASGEWTVKELFLMWEPHLSVLSMYHSTTISFVKNVPIRNCRFGRARLRKAYF